LLQIILLQDILSVKLIRYNSDTDVVHRPHIHFVQSVYGLLIAFAGAVNQHLSHVKTFGGQNLFFIVKTAKIQKDGIFTFFFQISFFAQWFVRKYNMLTKPSSV